MSEQSSFQRIINAVVVIVIVAGVLGMLLGARAGFLSLFVLPALIFAVAKFFVTAVRAVRDPSARIPALLLLGVLLLPVMQWKMAELPAHATQAVVQTEEPENEQFMAGHDWADREHPLAHSDCKGTQDFKRGCWTALGEQRKQEEQEGERWAQEHRPSRVSECTVHKQPHVEVGCHRYFFAHLVKPKPEGQAKYEGMTTEECKVEIRAQMALSEKMNYEAGTEHANDSQWINHWMPELADCENYYKITHVR